MDGSFQDLDGESMEVKVDEFFREIFKMLKLFQQKQNKAEQEMEKIAGSTGQRPNEDDARKQESPTILLCSTVMEQIKEFKVPYVALISNGLITEVLSYVKSCLLMLLCYHVVWNAMWNVFVSTGPHPRSFHLV